MIVPLAAASAVDNAARILAQRMSQNMGQAIVVENQAGAAGLIGAERVAKAAPDGYTIGGFNDSIMTMLPNLHATMPWDILKDFEPISLVATVEWGLVVNNDAPYKTAARPDRRGEGEPRQDQLRFRRQRQPAARRHGGVRDDRRHFVDARALQGRNAGGARRCVGAGDRGVPGPLDRHVAGSRRQAAAARGDDAQSPARVSRTCRRCRSRACRGSSSTRGLR